MQLEYFQLIDRILDLNIDEKTIQVERRFRSTTPSSRGISRAIQSCPASC